MTDFATTGDGLMAGLQFLAEMCRTGQARQRIGAQFRSGSAIAQERAV